jgi:hypothetical protein
MSIVVALVALYFLPTILRALSFALLVVALVAAVNIALAVVAVAHAQQQTRTTCYDSFPARICETFDSMGNIISKSRCYRSGNDTRCDTQTFGGQTAPNGNGPQLVAPDAGWRYSPPNGDRPQR